MSKYQVVIFDWDGTLWNSGATIINVLVATARDLQITEPSITAIRNSIGLNLHDMLINMFPGVDYQLFAETFQKNYGAKTQQVQLFPGTREILQNLSDRGIKLAIATSKYRSGLIALLHKYDIDNLFSAIRCGDDDCPKPDPSMLYEILTELNIPASAALMIGDSEHDMLMAQRASVARIAVSYGVQDSAKLLTYKPIACIDDIQELPSLIN